MESVWCAICGGDSSPTGHWLRVAPVLTNPGAFSDKGGDVMERSGIYWYPGLSRYAHATCLKRTVLELSRLVGIQDLAEKLLVRLESGAEPVTCLICGKLEMVSHQAGPDTVYLAEGQRTLIYRHPTLGYIHSSCVGRVTALSRDLGLDMFPISVKLKVKPVHWLEFNRLTRHLSHWHTPTQIWNGAHIGKES